MNTYEKVVANPMLVSPFGWGIHSMAGEFVLEGPKQNFIWRGGSCEATYRNIVDGGYILLIAHIALRPMLQVEVAAFDMGARNCRWEPIYWPEPFQPMLRALNELAANFDMQLADIAPAIVIPPDWFDGEKLGQASLEQPAEQAP